MHKSFAACRMLGRPCLWHSAAQQSRFASSTVAVTFHGHVSGEQSHSHKLLTTKVHNGILQSSRRFASDKKPYVDPNVAIGQKFPEYTGSYDDKDVIVYNLGVGASRTHKNSLRFLYEGDKNFSVLPSYGVIPACQALVDGGLIPSPHFPGLLDKIPGTLLDPTSIVHGEHYLEVFKPLPTSATLTTKGTMTDIVDKKKGALLIQNLESFDEKGEKLIFNQFVTYVINVGGFGGKRSSDALIPTAKPPTRSPDAVIEDKISYDQAALYRLSGDRNPLHIDPEFAKAGGFEQPILHGLAFFGFAVRNVIQQYADNDVSKFKAVKVRFSSSVLPGQTLQTEMWQEGNRIHVVGKVAETGQVAISGAYVDLV